MPLRPQKKSTLKITSHLLSPVHLYQLIEPQWLLSPNHSILGCTSTLVAPQVCYHPPRPHPLNTTPKETSPSSSSLPSSPSYIHRETTQSSPLAYVSSTIISPLPHSPAAYLPVGLDLGSLGETAAASDGLWVMCVCV